MSLDLQERAFERHSQHRRTTERHHAAVDVRAVRPLLRDISLQDLDQLRPIVRREMLRELFHGQHPKHNNSL